MENIRKSLGKTLRFKVFHRDAFVCQYCGQKPPEVVLEIDHIVPVSKGGRNQIENLITACFDCNRGKRNGDLKEVPAQVEVNYSQIQEKYEQLKAFYKYQESLENLSNDRVDRLCELWSDLWDGKFELNLLGRNTIKRFLKDLNPEEIEEALCLGVERQPRNTSNAWKYACGVMWTKLRNKQNG